MSGITPDYAFLANTPALAPPPGEIPNLANPPRPILYISIATYCICIPLVIAAASVRVFTKSYVMKSIEYEDCKHVNNPKLKALLISIRCYRRCIGKVSISSPFSTVSHLTLTWVMV